MRSTALFLIGFFSACLVSWSTSVFTPRSYYFSKSFNTEWMRDTINIAIGNSRSLSAIDCNELGRTNPWVHMGYSSSDISTQIMALRHAEAKASMIDTILWEISPFSFDSRRVFRHHNFCRDLIHSHPPLILRSHNTYEASGLFPNRSTLPNLRQKVASSLSGDYTERWHCDEAPFNPLDQENLKEVFPDSRIRFDQEQMQYFEEELQRLASVESHLIILFTPSRRDFKSALSNYDEYKLIISQLINKTQIIDLDLLMHDSIFMDADHIACPTSFTGDVIKPALE